MIDNYISRGILGLTLSVSINLNSHTLSNIIDAVARCIGIFKKSGERQFFL